MKTPIMALDCITRCHDEQRQASREINVESESLTYAAIGLVIGLIIGAGCYRLLSKSQRQLASLRQSLLEREHQVASLKNGVSNQLSSVHESLATIRQEADELEKKLQEDAGQWQLDRLTHHPAALSDLRPTTSAPTDTASEPAMPRDYADGKNGTLSEDFGLKDKTASDETATAPRY
ncbi:YhcB family protein [Vreelandella gomseomensis]|uniref:DUF1043 family protein n=2 Tax=Halomonadaceae TaxID=28256 RepID=A0ABU1G8W0_9GAMM|nr:DUF1043 family protein [Halomonas gomseomensis]MDR5873925.1 DUF1043 family protein [Halomonas gomseomensis]